MLCSTILVLAVSASSAYSLVHGVDNSAPVDNRTYSKAIGDGFTHLVIRGYEQACSSGGQVDPNFPSSYHNARAAGYNSTEIDVYWFPCTGTNNPCKFYSEQLAELGAMLHANQTEIGRIWLYIENDPSCGTWDYGADGNVHEAMAIIAALRNETYNFGIYSSPGEWETIFGSQHVVLDSSIPLWFATYDGDDSSLTLSSPFGGWRTGKGKQYRGRSASGVFNLDIFAS
ncbi:glycoside hydrolase superfamily [Cantharellus anzutake]|uniref:glycoside hydrolase superfamily n=1 Tax=Cantharellus anzutake TaxID=1750568 RepID=UPI001904F8C2|nr:glycoside hydrolase superfamily [Cantharellus anzutake]KAF8336947.1 glycoside hydrolase superfamily [Cantharellus anzutake]